jgi:hypothetical protein
VEATKEVEDNNNRDNNRDEKKNKESVKWKT